MKGLTILAFLFTSMFAQAQTYSGVVYDKDIYQFVNWLQRTDHYPKKGFLQRKRIYSKIDNWYSREEMEELLNPEEPFVGYVSIANVVFSELDNKYILEQYDGIRDSVWHKKFNRSKMVETGNPPKPVFFYSIPLFSVDGQYVLMNKGYYCGPMCFHKEVSIYKRKSADEWELLQLITFTEA